MHSTIHAVCGQQKGQNRAKSHVFFLVKRAGRHFGFFKRAGRHEKGAGRRALQKKPRQNTANPAPCQLLDGGASFAPDRWQSFRQRNRCFKCDYAW